MAAKKITAEPAHKWEFLLDEAASDLSAISALAEQIAEHVGDSPVRALAAAVSALADRATGRLTVFEVA